MPVDTTGRRTLAIIGLLKLGKAIVLIVLAVFLTRLTSDTDPAGRLEQWLHQFRPGLVTRAIDTALGKLLALPPSGRRALDVGVIAYAALFAVEGIGLLMARRWAEWVTILTTSLLIPFELYELYERPTAIVRIALLIANVAILIYLVWRIRRKAT